MIKSKLDIKMPDSAFSIAIIPDTHIRDEFSESLHESQALWIAKNHSKYAIRHVIHLGDIVDNATDVSQWKKAMTARDILISAGVPVAYTAGNHNLSAWQQQVPFHQYKDDDRDQNELYLTFVSGLNKSNITNDGVQFSPNGWNSYHYFSFNNHKYMILMLDYAAGDNTFAWAKTVLDENRSIPTILATHILITHQSATENPDFEYPEALQIWTDLIYPNNQVIMAVGGHYFGQGHVVKSNCVGNPVLLSVTNYQHIEDLGGGMMNLVVVDTDRASLRWHSFSPRLMSFKDSQQKPVLSDDLNAYEFAFGNNRFAGI